MEIEETPVSPPQETPETPPSEQTSETEAVAAEAPAPLTLEDIPLPEGFELEPEVGEKFLTALSNEELAPKERAQALVELHSNMMRQASEKVSKQFTEAVEGWRKETKEHPEFGGAELDKTLSRIARVVDEFGGDDFREIMDTSGLGNHPTVVSFLNKVALSFNEGKPVTGSPTSQPASKAERLFGDLVK